MSSQLFRKIEYFSLAAYLCLTELNWIIVWFCVTVRVFLCVCGSWWMCPSEGRVSDQHLAVLQNLQQHKTLTEPVELLTFSCLAHIPFLHVPALQQKHTLVSHGITSCSYLKTDWWSKKHPTIKPFTQKSRCVREELELRSKVNNTWAGMKEETRNQESPNLFTSQDVKAHQLFLKVEKVSAPIRTAIVQNQFRKVVVAPDWCAKCWF